MKEIIKRIEESVIKKRTSRENGLNIFLDYLIDMFDIKYVIDNSFTKHLQKKKEEDIDLFYATIEWMNIVTEYLEHDKCIDMFGNIYTEMYQSKGKASVLGQFFTPPHVCDLMAGIIGENVITGNIISDPACGSGRTLLAAFVKYKKGYYIGEDIDLVSVKMCALNMMIYGMRGRAICHDTIQSPVYFGIGYEINEVRYPMPTPLYSIREISNKEPYMKNENMKVEQLNLF